MSRQIKGYDAEVLLVGNPHSFRIIACRSAALEGFEFVEGTRPVGAEQPRQAAIGEELAAGLAGGAVVGFVVGVSNTLNGRAAPRAGLAEAAVNCHFRTECSDAFGKLFPGLGDEAVHP